MSSFDVVLRFGFLPDGHRGSHQFYRLAERSVRLNLQPRRGEAKEYQVRQLLTYVEEFQLDGTARPLQRAITSTLFFSREDDCLVADVPDLRYCSAFGDTAAETLREVETAIELYLESCERHGDPIPEPRYVPLIYQATG